MVGGVDAHHSLDPLLMMILVDPCFSSFLPYRTVSTVILTFCHLVIMALVLLTHDRQPLSDLRDVIYVIDVTYLSLYFAAHILLISHIISCQ